MSALCSTPSPSIVCEWVAISQLATSDVFANHCESTVINNNPILKAKTTITGAKIVLSICPILNISPTASEIAHQTLSPNVIISTMIGDTTI